jgi:nucleotide-binding universal stress UspA family protein
MDIQSKPALIRSILLATDGSAPAERAAAFAAVLALQTRAKITVLHVRQVISANLGEPYFEDALLKTLDEAAALVEMTARRLHEQGVLEVETDVIGGLPSEVILTVAETRRADLIVMGVRGLNPLQSILLGSVSQAVIQHAKYPVVVVK